MQCCESRSGWTFLISAYFLLIYDVILKFLSYLKQLRPRWTFLISVGFLLIYDVILKFLSYLKQVRPGWTFLISACFLSTSFFRISFCRLTTAVNSTYTVQKTNA